MKPTSRVPPSKGQSVLNCAFVIPGDLMLATGGYAYDRHVLAGLAAHGVAVSHVPLPGSYPTPTHADIAASDAALATLPVDATLLIDGLAYGAFPASLLARIKQRVVALVHHPLGLETGTPPARAAELVQLETAALARADHVIVTSPLTKRLLVADFAVPDGKVTVAEPGTVPAMRATGSAGGRLHLLAVGSIVPRKGYTVLIQALEPLVRKTVMDQSWRLTIAGSPRDAGELQRIKRAANSAGIMGSLLDLAGAVTDEALNALYSSADIFVMPSLYEGYGMVLAEAMARGLPIVCTTGGAAAETAPDAAALKVPPGDYAALRKALARVITEPELRRSLADASWDAGQRLPRWHDTARIIANCIHATATKGFSA
jgi:glycosyltransferase involved in cell wall biosynthesis